MRQAFYNTHVESRPRTGRPRPQSQPQMDKSLCDIVLDDLGIFLLLRPTRVYPPIAAVSPFRNSFNYLMERLENDMQASATEDQIMDRLKGVIMLPILFGISTSRRKASRLLRSNDASERMIGPASSSPHMPNNQW
jgi:hypothetical protein